MRISLYTAANNLAELLDQVDPETGELPAGLDFAQLILDNEAYSAVAYILESRATIESIKARKSELSERENVLEKRASKIEKDLILSMKKLSVPKIEAADKTFDATLFVGRDVSVEVYDAAAVPAKFIRTKTSTEVDKVAVKKAIKAGCEVAGARLSTNDRLTIKG